MKCPLCNGTKKFNGCVAKLDCPFCVPQKQIAIHKPRERDVMDEDREFYELEVREVNKSYGRS